MIIDNGNVAQNRQKYVHLLEFQPQRHAIFCLNLHRFQAEWAASQFELLDTVCVSSEHCYSQ